jgi:hypothetical protein
VVDAALPPVTLRPLQVVTTFQHEPTTLDQRTRKLANLATTLGADLAKDRGDEPRPRSLVESAVESFLTIEREAGAADEVTADELQ